MCLRSTTPTQDSYHLSFSVSNSGAKLAPVRARGQTARARHAMMATSAHGVTRVRMANVQRHLSLATRCVSTVMATAAVSKRALDLQAYARARSEVCVPYNEKKTDKQPLRSRLCQ